MDSRSSTPTGLVYADDLQRNNESLPWTVQKYGGTSVGKSLGQISSIVESYLPTAQVAVVCSARSSSTKALGTTNLLLQASKQALRPRTSSPPGSRAGASGSATPLYPKRVGSGFFSANGVEKLSSASDRDLAGSSSSLRDLKLTNSGAGNARTESPSPFQSSSYWSGQSSGSSSPSSSGILTHPQASGFKPDSASFHSTVDILKRDHLEAARQAVVKDQYLLAELEEEIERDCEGLRSFLSAAQVSPAE